MIVSAQANVPFAFAIIMQCLWHLNFSLFAINLQARLYCLSMKFHLFRAPNWGKEISHISSLEMMLKLTLSLLRVINVKIPLQPHKKYDITQYGELDFS